MALAKSPLKWVGGKARLVAELVARMPPRYGRYFEPFCGGAALFFHLGPQPAILSDTNAALINTYRAIRKDTQAVIDHLAAHKYRHASDDGYYYDVRASFNNGRWADDKPAQAAAFVYLNKTCFNGLWRVNRNGAFNVPKGDYKDPAILDEQLLRSAAAALQSAELAIDSYANVAQRALAGDFVYLDPPYDPVSETSNFTSYTKDAFGKIQQRELAEHARALRERGVHVMLSNNDTAYVRSLYQDFCIDNVKCGRSINSKADARGKVDEVIITSYERTS